MYFIYWKLLEWKYFCFENNLIEMSAYRQTSNIRHNKFQNLNVSSLILQLHYIWVTKNLLSTKLQLVLEVWQ